MRERQSKDKDNTALYRTDRRMGQPESRFVFVGVPYVGVYLTTFPPFQQGWWTFLSYQYCYFFSSKRSMPTPHTPPSRYTSTSFTGHFVRAVPLRVGDAQLGSHPQATSGHLKRAPPLGVFRREAEAEGDDRKGSTSPW